MNWQIYINLQSLNILIDQHTLFFLFRFFQVFKIHEETIEIPTPVFHNTKKNDIVDEAVNASVKESYESITANKIFFLQKDIY